ncbi:MAG: potassium-transporting ATPase subunit KdpA, partial [Anaerolineae bacterium]|nr:potassium-transporting ATPase subunit KdpA [Anaerolineae bacterium]
MTVNSVLQLAFYMVVLLLVVKPLGTYMANVYEGRSFVNRILSPAERLLYRLFGVREDDEMNWKTYALAFMVFNVLGLLVVYGLQRVQTSLPLNQGTLFLTTGMTADS